MNPMVIATGQTITATLMLLPIVLIVDQPWTLPLPRLDATLAAMTLAILSTALAYVLYFRLIDRAGASNAQLVAFIMPVLAVILGVAFLNETLAARQITGALLIALGLIILDGRFISWLALRRTVL
jgi:drug/metabolite transporter (DMT)-like permease